MHLSWIDSSLLQVAYSKVKRLPQLFFLFQLGASAIWLWTQSSVDTVPSQWKPHSQGYLSFKCSLRHVIWAACVVTSLAIEKEARIFSSVVDQVSSQKYMDLHNVSCVTDIESTNGNEDILPISPSLYEHVTSMENVLDIGSYRCAFCWLQLCMFWCYYCWECWLLHWKWGLLHCVHPSWLEQCSYVYGISIAYGFQEPVIWSHFSCWSDWQLNLDSIVASFCSHGEWQSFQLFWASWSMPNPKFC